MVKGYKVFNPDWTCRGFKFEAGNTYEENVTPECCEKGFHFCLNATDCFRYYSFSINNKVAEVTALGEIDYSDDDTKCATNIIKIDRELAWEEVLKLVNTGKSCTGLGNTGNRNTGNWNTGDWNTGDRNTGNWNTGDRNTRNWNTGDWNTGDRNTGDCNTGDCNTGDRNTGNWNTGNCNTGDRNTGNWNTGNWNTGDRNTGNWNTGNCNTGDRNTGNWNTGNWNTGDWNTIDSSSGIFNTVEHNIKSFNKESNITLDQWRGSDAYHLLRRIKLNPVEWIYEEGMTEGEKEKNPTYETCGGYLKKIDTSEACKEWWRDLSVDEKCIIQNIENFDKDVFYQITGINVEED